MKEDRSACSKSSDGVDPAHDVELGSVDSGNVSHGSRMILIMDGVPQLAMKELEVSVA